MITVSDFHKTSKTSDGDLYMLSAELIPYLEEIKHEVLSIIHKQRPQLTRDDLEDTYQDAVVDLLGSSKEVPSSKEHLTQIMIKKCLGGSYKELNQQRNDTYLLSGYTGSNMSRYPHTHYPEEFLRVCTELQATLGRCLNAHMTYSEINTHLNGKFDSSIQYLRKNYQKWLQRKPVILSEKDKTYLRNSNRDPRSIELIERLLKGELIGHIAKDLKMKPTTAWNLKYEILQDLPHLKNLIPRKNAKRSSKIATYTRDIV